MEHLIVFGILSLPIIVLSWRSLFSINSHGFYRFFSWECIAWLMVANFQYWFVDPFSVKQLFSWVFLFFSAYLVIAGMILLNRSGNQDINRDGKTLYEFEKTTELIDNGIYKYIRHPLYSSLLFLTWGIFLKHPADSLFFVALISSLFLFLTAIFDEKECAKFFGDKYIAYMKRSKRFIPFLF